MGHIGIGLDAHQGIDTSQLPEIISALITVTQLAHTAAEQTHYVIHGDEDTETDAPDEIKLRALVNTEDCTLAATQVATEIASLCKRLQVLQKRQPERRDRDERYSSGSMRELKMTPLRFELVKLAGEATATGRQAKEDGWRETLLLESVHTGLRTINLPLLCEHIGTVVAIAHRISEIVVETMSEPYLDNSEKCSTLNKLEKTSRAIVMASNAATGLIRALCTILQQRRS